MGEETRVTTTLKIKPSVLKKAKHAAIDDDQDLAELVETAIEEHLKGRRKK